MVAFLQKTKLFTPPVRDKLVTRSRLNARLDQLCQPGARLGLICAPAGSGKTTAVVQWLRQVGWPSTWLALDARDNALPRFFAYLLAALQKVVPTLGGELTTLINLPGANVEEVVELLADGLAQAEQPFLLVVDDFHLITNPVLHRALDLLVEAQPPQMRLVLLSREDPPIQLARRRARGQLVELRQEDLRFTAQEAMAFLTHTMDLQLTIDQIQRLETRTEGWIAGLQLAALSLQSNPDVDQFLQNFSGGHRFILDYLIEEVLSQQPADVQRFLLETSILDRLCASLCATVTGCTETAAQQVLEQLARANLFLVPLDDERRWFRYHHLFRDLLVTQLQITSADQAAQFELRAADWHEAAGDPRLAVECCLRAKDFPKAADLLERYIGERWQTVDLEFHLLLNRLPVEILTQRPALCLQGAWLSVLFGQVERILPLVEAAERVILNPAHEPQPEDRTVLAFAHTLRAYVADLHNQPVAADARLEAAYAAIPKGNVGMANSVAVVIGTIAYMEGDFPTALRYFEEALERDQRVNGTNAVPIATMRIVLVLQALGRLHAAEQRLQAAYRYVTERGIRRFYIAGVLPLQLAALALEWNRLDEAEHHLQTGLRLLEDWPIHQMRVLGLSLLARWHMAMGQPAEARAVILQADQLVQGHQIHPAFVDALEQARVRLLVAMGESAALHSWIQTNQQLSHASDSFRFENRRIELARALIAVGRRAEADNLLHQLDTAAYGRNGSRITILCLRAVAADSLTYLEEALRLAEPAGYLRTFVEVGLGLEGLLDRWLQEREATRPASLYSYGSQIRAAFGSKSPAVKPVSLLDLPEPLSQREEEVLHLVAKGLTNQQIADRLVISVRTVKKHLENILGKLGVHNRTEAVDQARKLGLLS